MIDYNYISHVNWNGENAVNYIEDLDWPTLRAVFTQFQRGERFSPGYIEGLVKEKTIYKALKRLEYLIQQQNN